VNDGKLIVVGAIDCDIPKQRAQNAAQGHYIAIQGNLIGRDAGGPHGIGVAEAGPMYTLTKTDVHGVAIPIQDGVVTEKAQNGLGVGDEGDPAYTMDTRGAQAIAFHPTQDPISSTDGSTHALGCGSSQGCATVAVAVDFHNQTISGDITATLSCTGGGPKSGPSLMCGMSVRRLTPTECERLQGFPDGWTAGQADSHRYKQLGNAVTVNVAEWIARRTRTWMRKQ